MRISSKQGQVLLAAAGILLLPASAIAQDIDANNVTVGNVVEGDATYVARPSTSNSEERRSRAASASALVS